MKTKEEILKDLADPIREAVLSAITPIISNAMTMYSDQQNKELRDRLEIATEQLTFQNGDLIIENNKLTAKIQRLMKELDEVKTSHYQKLDAQLVEDVERLTEENKELREKVKALDDHRIKIEEMELTERNRANKADAEIQRLTKEVEELKLRLSGKTFFNPFEQENTRLRELLAKYSGAVAANADFLKNLNAEISNALNHKP